MLIGECLISSFHGYIYIDVKLRKRHYQTIMSSFIDKKLLIF